LWLRQQQGVGWADDKTAGDGRSKLAAYISDEALAAAIETA